MSFLINVLGNVLANIVGWGTLGVAFWIGGKASRTHFLQFFGAENSRSIAIFLSNLWTPDIPLLYSRRSAGYMVSKHELLATRSFDSLFGVSPTRLPEIVRGLVDAFWLQNRITCRMEVSPPTVEEVCSVSNLIIVGASPRNSMRRYYVSQGLPTAVLPDEVRDVDAELLDETHEAIIRRGDGKNQSVRSELNIAIIEKIHIASQRRTVFFCLGIRADATWGATEYLARNWKKLEREFGVQPFVVCLGFPKVDPYSEEYSDPTVLAWMRP